MSVKWIGTEYEQYLRPETLFGPKFESYLNAKVIQPKAGQQGQGSRRSGGNVFLDMIDDEGTVIL